MTRRAALGPSSVTVILLVALIVPTTLAIYTFFKAPDLLPKEARGAVPESFEPFSEVKLKDQIELQVRESRVAGTVTQVLYTVDIEEERETYGLAEAVRLYAFCEGEDADSILMCSSFPSRGTIEREAREDLDGIFRVKGGVRPYNLTVVSGGEQLISVGDADSGESTFRFDVPLPGGKHASIVLYTERGSISTGVVSRG